MLHVHAPLVAPLGTGHMAQPGAEQHQSRVAIQERLYTGTAVNHLVQPFNDNVGTDTWPVFTGKIAICTLLLNAVLQIAYYSRR